MDVETDEQADWAAALGHDPGAFARVFDRHRDAVFRQALRVLEHPADAEEAASAAFFELWRKRDRVRLVGGSVRPWLLVTAANLARNSQRTRVRREQFLRRLADGHRAEEGDAAFERIDEGVLRHELVEGLRALKPQDVALVTMTALDGYSVREVAELLGLTDGAARVRLSRAHARLRGLLEDRAGRRNDSQEVTR